MVKIFKYFYNQYNKLKKYNKKCKGSSVLILFIGLTFVLGFHWLFKMNEFFQKKFQYNYESHKIKINHLHEKYWFKQIITPILLKALAQSIDDNQQLLDNDQLKNLGEKNLLSSNMTIINIEYHHISPMVIKDGPNKIMDIYEFIADSSIIIYYKINNVIKKYTISLQDTLNFSHAIEVY